MNTMNTFKAAVVSFIIFDLTIMLLFAVCAKTNEIVYADSLSTAESFIGQPVDAVTLEYGSPDGWQFIDNDSAAGTPDAYWYFGKTIFHICYDDPEDTSGTVVDVEVLR